MISIIIVGYNSKQYLDECLSSIFNSGYKKFRIVFVDNGSTDGSSEYVKKKFPKVKIVDNKNTGFAGGNNVGIKFALKTKTDYLFLLNPDTIIDKDCLENLVDKADENTILQPLILLHNGKKQTNKINSAGNVLNFLGISYCGSYRCNKNDVKSDGEITLASGAAMFIPASIVRKIGVFDEKFFMYHEDVDLCWRARISGNNIKLIKDALVWHKYSFSRNKNKLYYAERNRLIFLYKNFSTKYLILISPALIINEIFLTIYAMFSGWGIKKLQASIQALRLMPRYKGIRKDNLSYILKTQPRLKYFLSSNITFSGIGNPIILWPYNLLTSLYWIIIKPII